MEDALNQLFNEFGMLTEHAFKISKEFDGIVRDFIINACHNCKGRDVSSLLCEIVDLICSEERIKQSIEHHLASRPRTLHNHYNGKACLGPDCIYCDEEEAMRE